MSEIAANRAANADWRMRHLRRRLPQQRMAARHLGPTFEVAVPNQGTQPELAIRSFVDRGELHQPIDVDQCAGTGEAKIHCGDEALAPGQKARLAAQPGL